MLHCLYKIDSATYSDKRQRVQLGFLILNHAFSGLRPSSITRAGAKHFSKESRVKLEEDDPALQGTEGLVKLRYKDIKNRDHER